MNNLIACRIANTLNSELVSYTKVKATVNVVHSTSGTAICKVVDGTIYRLYNTPEIELVLQNLEQF